MNNDMSSAGEQSAAASTAQDAPYGANSANSATENLLPSLTRGSLTALCDAGALSPEAWQKSLEFCGFTPDGKAWMTYWRNIFLLGGALFFLAGVICFIAWNWGTISPFERMALVGSLVAATGAGAVVLGPDTRPGQILLLACGISMGPMMAVFGQTYQTGAELWELFRVWTVLLCLLALVGKQVGLWFTAWIVGSLFAALWFGRSFSSPFDALGAFFILPEWLLVIACAIIIWEWAARRAVQRARQSWLRSRWMPRLLFFDLIARCTAYLLMYIFFDYSLTDESFLWLPQQFVPFFAVVTGGISWWWYRQREPDLFMLAVLLGAATTVFLAFLADAELFFSAGTGTALLFWGLLVTGVTAGLAKLLLHLQKSMAAEKNNAEITTSHNHSFFVHDAPGISWQRLWEYLQSQGLIDQETPLPIMNTPFSPWYVRMLPAFGGWLAACLFTGFLAFSIFVSLQIVTHEEAAIFMASIPILLLGRALLAKNTTFTRHFGFALAITGTVGISISLFLTAENAWPSLFLLALLLTVVGWFMRNPPYTFLAAGGVVTAVALGLSFLFIDGPGWLEIVSVKALAYLPLVWWAAVSLGLAYFCLHEKSWRGKAAAHNADAVFFGAYTGMLVSQIYSLGTWYLLTTEILIMGANQGMSIGAALGLGYLAVFLSRGRQALARTAVLLGAVASFALSLYLPGVVLALLGLALARQMGNLVMQGFVLAYLMIYMTFYYYTLNVSFAEKSLYLVMSGIILLLIALILRIWSAKTTKKEAAHA